MVKSSSTLRAEARAALKGKWLIAIIAMILATILGAFSYAPSVNTGGNVNPDGVYSEPMVMYDNEGNPHTIEDPYALLEETLGEETMNLFSAYIAVTAAVGGVVSLILFVLGSAIALGYKKFNIDLLEGSEANVGTLFSRFGIILKAVWLRILTGLKVFLWSLLLFIPGIIAAYRYSMAPYLMAENPELSAGEAIKLSKRMMDGNKWRLFCLHFSFIGWAILCLFTCGIGFLWLNPYQYAAEAAFFKTVAGDYAEETATATEIPVQVTE